MQKDFHYYCIGVLAKAAGFNSVDALTIAYASQYVDNSTESELIRLEVGSDYLMFDPVRTAHIGLESLEWSTQKRIYLPFHFVPPKQFKPADLDVNGTFSLITRSNSPFAQSLLDKAETEPLENYNLRLCRIGIALHTYADAWSHEGFSGRQNKENDVGSIYLYDRKKDKYDQLHVLEKMLDILPQIGHAEAGFYPDLAFQKWKCEFGHRQPPNNRAERDNVEHFINAADFIYKRLKDMQKTGGISLTPWGEIEPRIRKLLSYGPSAKPGIIDQVSLKAYTSYSNRELGDSCERWKKEFGNWFDGGLSYDHLDWRNKAVYGDTDWDDYTMRDWDRILPFKPRPGFWNSLWVNFQRAALRQRHYVLENLP